MNKKKKILLIANIIAFALALSSIFFEWIIYNSGRTTVESFMLYSLLYCAFVFMSLVVYYLSIIADALSKRYKEQAEKEKNEK